MNKRKLANLVVHGVNQTQIALALGVTDSYISQLINDDPETKELIAQVAAARTENDTMNELTLLKIERQLIHKVADLVESSESLGESVRALRDIKDIQAKDKLIKAGSGQDNSKKVTINVNQVLAQKIDIHTDSANQIVGIGERSMATMPTQKVLETLGITGKSIHDVILGT